MKIEELYQCFLQCEKQLSTDTRHIQPNSLFIALKGAHFDGNSFAEEALRKGALFAVIDDKRKMTNPKKMLLVEDALLALQELAHFHRRQLGLPVLALTGSNGKTTTKELIAAVLSQKYNVKATLGNLNNHIGVPLTLLSFDENTDIGVVEMGANHQGEIAALCDIAQPDYGYVTNFGKAHLEGFGSYEGVIKAKSELYHYLQDSQKIAFVNTDDPIQDARTLNINRYTFGTEQDNDLLLSDYKAQPNVSISMGGITIHSHLTGLYNANNVSAALAVGRYFGISIEECKTAIEAYVPRNNRSQWVVQNNSDILLDAYNANPSSMEAALDNFIQLKTPKEKVVILGDMFELGRESSREHLKIVKALEATHTLQAYLIGAHFFSHHKELRHIRFFENFESFAQQPSIKELLAGKTILIKGSRGMALERIIDMI